jgi:hypothetical protein
MYSSNGSVIPKGSPSVLRRFLAGGYPAGMVFVLYAASVATLCVALYECDRRDETLTASAAGSLLFAFLSIIPFLCLLLAGWGAYFSLVRAMRAGDVLAANLSKFGQIVVLVTADRLALLGCRQVGSIVLKA